ncbi:TPA: catalase family peroxidase [Enterobacter roggenkampii]|uniref:catalase family peroxidase n=1 Tax=Enterobacter roggenkampii TaxID=1812935 RepID=UPI002005E798|nr:catalase family peroxidase [Enterobacter roggenkampii]MCK7368720.1 catalase family peroxidase [Enterobacter roggenkampii]
MSKLDLRSKKTWGALAAIAVVAGTLASAFAWTAGWLGSRTVSQALVGETPKPFPPGFRRAHGKGICFAGTFTPNGSADSLSISRLFSQQEVPVVGRFSIGTGDPHAPDSTTKTLSMALLLKTDDKQQWRMAMNNEPFFATHSPEGFLALRKATAVDAATGKPDPQRLKDFLKAYPEAEKYLKWAAQKPAPGSFAGATFYSINAFYFVNAQGERQAVRWMMRPHEPFLSISDEQRQKADDNFLFENLRQRLAQKPLYWDYILQLAQLGDPVDDPSQPWPDDRKKVVAGTLEVTRVEAQSTGACRDVNFDPSVVPAGVAVSDDPILNARSAAYSHSFSRREREIGYGKATEAVQKQEVK